MAIACPLAAQEPDPFPDTNEEEIAFDEVFDDATDATEVDEPPVVEEEATPSPTTGDGTAEETLVVRSELVQAALRSIEAMDPKTPTELLRAVHLLQRLGATDDARGFLERVVNQSTSQAELVQIHKQMGTGTLAQIANNRNLGPSASTLVRAVFAAVRQTKQDPERIQALIRDLANDDEELRRRAILGIAEAGGHAVAELLDAYRRPPEGVSTADLDAATSQLGARSEEPLIAALGSPDPTVQQTAARLLGRVGTSQARIHLIRPCFASSAAIRTAAVASLATLQIRQPSSAASSANYLYEHARRQLLGKTPSPAGFDGTVAMWTWSAEENNLVAHRLNGHEASAVIAARLARDAFELDPSSRNEVLMLVSRLQVDQLLGGLDQVLPRGVGTGYELAHHAGTQATSDALAWSLKHQLDAAAQGATEVLGDLGDVSAVMQSGSRTPLVSALQSPARRVRYGAARALMTIDPRKRYSGASHLLETLIDLARAKGRSRALLGTPRQVVAERLSGMLSGLGLDPLRIASAREFMLEAVSSSDFDVLLVSDSVNRLSVSELIQQLRKSSKTQYLPIVLLVRNGQLRRAERIASRSDLVFVMPEYADESTLVQTLTTAEASVRNVSVAPQRRLQQARDALNWLGHIAEYSQSYEWYDIMRARAVAEDAVHIPELSDQAIDLLGFLGDRNAQQLLLENASLRGFSSEHRQRAANAFAESVLRRGLMLRSADVARQYDRHRTSDDNDESTREILGQILDVIEMQTKSTSTNTR